MNKVILLALFILFLEPRGTGSGQISENFESGNASRWIQSPEGRWNTVDSYRISGNFSLHHSFDNPEAGNDFAGLSLENFYPGEGEATWSFSIRTGFEPSSSNNWLIFLMSDSGPASIRENHNQSGFAVGVNQTGYDDTLRLWKVREGSFSTVISSKVNWQTMINTSEAAVIKIVRSEQGIWRMNLFNSSGLLLDSSTGADRELFNSDWFVIAYRYTSTRDMLLWFDDLIIEGMFHEDKTSPGIVDCMVAGRNSLLVTFSEEPDISAFTPSNFSIENNRVAGVVRISPVRAGLTFSADFENKVRISLTAHKLCDRNGKRGNEVRREFTPSWAEPGDVIFSEIMADPSPAVSLPGKEYLELLNRSGFPVNLRKWTLATESQDYLFPEKTIAPETYLIVCPAADTLLFSGYGPTLGLRSFPALTDAGRTIALRDSSGNLIHGVEYSRDWYRDELKSDGGWSLEMIDTNYPFYEDGNWHASMSDSGGSPGRVNSVDGDNPDPVFSGIENVFPSDSESVMLTFSESVFYPGSFPEKILIDDQNIKSIRNSDLLLRRFSIETPVPLTKGKIYSLSAAGEVKDFAGNKMIRNSFGFGLTERAKNGDVMFNELLFNPLPGDPDYIEFVSCTDRIIDASRLLVVSVNDETADTSSVLALSPEGRCILPGDYYVITTNRQKLQERYFQSDNNRIFEVASLPSMPDDKGHLILLNRELEIIDEVYYNEKMQYSLLQYPEGISLEKVRPDYASSERSYWQSASESAGWGTPGTKNSEYNEDPAGDDIVRLSSTRITPDNDGNDDFLAIDLSLAGNGNVVSVWIFDESGVIVNKLTDNLFAGSSASVIWNGTSTGGKLVETGIYILLIQIFNDTGKIHKWKKVCTVIR